MLQKLGDITEVTAIVNILLGSVNNTRIFHYNTFATEVLLGCNSYYCIVSDLLL